MFIITLDCKGFSRTSLPISKDADIVTIDSTLHKSLNILKYLFLTTVFSIDRIKIKNLRHFRFWINTETHLI